jgi:hypothetical protein
MKRVLFVAVLALALPMAAFATSSNSWTDFSSVTLGSSLVTGGSTISLNAGLAGAYGFNGGGLVAGSLGTMSFTTGALISSAGGVEEFGSGGSFEITGNGTGGLPDGVIFKGTFSGTVVETITAPGTDHPGIQLACLGPNGCLTGTWYNGKSVTGFLMVNSTPAFGGSIFATASFQPSAVPEPGTLSMLGTGLLGLGVLVRRKLKA